MSDLIFVVVTASFFHDPGPGHAHRSLSHDRADHGPGWLARAEENRPNECGDLPGVGRHLHRAAPGHDPVDRRVEFSAGTDAWSDRRALPHRPGKTVLTR